MTLRQQLERADKQLAELCDENGERFDVAYNIVHRARELALKDGQAKAAKYARKISGPLSPAEAREIIAAMIAALPESKSDLLTITSRKGARNQLLTTGTGNCLPSYGLF
jgi:hypothetical protein